MSTWTIDPDHSVAAFAVKHLKVAYVRGQFNRISGTITFDPSDIAGATAEATIDASSLITGIRKRDDHVMSADFIEASTFPFIAFRSTKVEAAGGSRAKMTGDLTIRGITKPVTLDVEFAGPVKSPFGGEITMGFSAAAVVDRFAYGVSWNEIMEDGGFMIDRDVKITIDIEADLKE
ncbi:MAG TPA: YceI family protein [Thermodesulfovibrionales bacterium]|nr:YceI family protein [Thermodesulfovibrionales bacterium]